MLSVGSVGSVHSILPIQTGGIPGLRLDALLILFIILPGLAFTKSYIYGIRKSDTLDRWDKIGYVLIGGVISGMVFLFVHQQHNGTSMVTSGNFASRPLLELIYGVLLQTGTAALLGFIIGEAVHLRDGQTYRTIKDREDPWDYTAPEIREKYVLIETTDGKEIGGTVARYESGNGDDDILISGVASGSERKLPNNRSSNAVFLRGEEISKIHFIDSETNIEDLEDDSDFGANEVDKIRQRENEIDGDDDTDNKDE